MSPFNVIMMRTFISTNISDTVIEAARIDGESEFGILFRIVLPMSAPILATVGLFSGLGYWNDWIRSGRTRLAPPESWGRCRRYPSAWPSR